MPPSITAVLHTDPACPWAYSAIPALRVLDWRYGDRIAWRLVLIGLTEDAAQYAERGNSPARMVRSNARFRDRFGMPFALLQKSSLSATARGCRAVVAARIDRPGGEWAVLRALQLANFTTTLRFDDDEALAAALDAVPGIDGASLVARLDDDDVTEGYERDRAEARTAAGSPAQMQGKTAATDGPVRYTAPSLILERDGRRLEAGGWQSLDAYDVLVANLDPGLPRRPPPESAQTLLHLYPEGLTTQEVVALMTHGNDAPDRTGVELHLLRLVADGGATRRVLGQDALWTRT